MSWNEVKVALVPSGSEVCESRDESKLADDGYPVTVLTVRPPSPAAGAPVSANEVDTWLIERGFTAFIKKPNSTRFRFNDIEVLVRRAEDSVMEVFLNFQVELDAGTPRNLGAIRHRDVRTTSLAAH